MKYIAICFLLLSCNVVKTLTGGDTSPSNDFFDNERNFKKSKFIFFNCDSSNPCFLSTEDSSVTNMDPSVQNAYEFIYFDGYIFYQGTTSGETDLFRYDIESEENKRIPLYPGNNSNPNSFVLHQGELYFLAETTAFTGGTLCKLASGDSNPDCRGSFPIASNYWIASVDYSNHTQSKLYVCQIAGSDILKEVDTNHASFLVTPVDPAGAPTEVECDNTNPKANVSGEFIYVTQGAGYVYKYDPATNTRTDYSPSAGPTYARGSNIVSFFYEDSGNLYVTKESNTVNSFVQLGTDGTYNPGNPYFTETVNAYFYTEKDGSSQDQVFQALKSNPSSHIQITSFTGENILYLTGMDGDTLYVFTFTDIFEYTANGVNNIYQGSISNNGFSTVNHGDTY